MFDRNIRAFGAGDAQLCRSSRHAVEPAVERRGRRAEVGHASTINRSYGFNAQRRLSSIAGMSELSGR